MVRFTNAGSFATRLTGSFARAEANAHRLIQDEASELFTHVPMVSRANYPPEPDPARQIRDVRAVFFWESALALSDRHLDMKGVTSRNPMLILHRCDLGKLPQRQDRFVRCDGTIFEVTSVEPDGLSGVVVQLVQQGRHK